MKYENIEKIIKKAMNKAIIKVKDVVYMNYRMAVNYYNKAVNYLQMAVNYLDLAGMAVKTKKKVYSTTLIFIPFSECVVLTSLKKRKINNGK